MVWSCEGIVGMSENTNLGSNQGQTGAGWDDWRDGVRFIRERLEDYARRGIVRPDQIPGLTAYYDKAVAAAQAAQAGTKTNFSTNLPHPTHCWNCGHANPDGSRYCRRCGSVLFGEAVQKIRYVIFLERTITSLQTEKLLELNQAHAIQTDAQNERQELVHALQAQRLSAAALFKLQRENLKQPAPPPPVPDTPGLSHTPPPLPPKRSVMEVLLDPQTIQWLLASGGLLLVVGFLIYLGSRGLFDKPIYVAVLMAIGTLGVLGIGWLLLLKTRYQLAGRAVTLLACLAMPLHLWFYHAQGLMSVDGKLWVPAMVICLLYVASAYVLKDPLFVYVSLAGVTMTGLLILQDINHFKEIASPSMFLMILGLLAIHAERAFKPVDESPFSRKRFGLAFFFSGQGLLVGAMGLLLGAQIVGWLWGPLMAQYVTYERPFIADHRSLKILGLLVVCGAIYGWLYSALVVRRKSIYGYAAGVAMLWAVIMIIDIWAIHVSLPMVAVALSLVAVVALLAQKGMDEENEVRSSMQAMGLLLGWIALALCTYMSLRDRGMLGESRIVAVTYTTACATLLAAAVLRVGAWVQGERHKDVAGAFFFGSAFGLILAVSQFLMAAGHAAWYQQAPVLMLVPIGYLIACKLYGERPPALPSRRAALASVLLLLALLIPSVFEWGVASIKPVAGSPINLRFALIAFEYAIFFGLWSAITQKRTGLYLATASICAALWQLFGYYNQPASVVVNGYALIGLLLLVFYRIGSLDQQRQAWLAPAAFVCGNGLLLVSLVASTLMTLADIAGKRIANEQLFLTTSIAFISLIAAALNRAGDWRRWNIIAFAIQIALAVVCLQQRLVLSAWQNVELFLVLAGVATVLASHWSILKSTERRNDVASLGLFIGSLAICLPLAIATWYFRFNVGDVSMLDELCLITASILLAVSGVILKLRATTLVGAFFFLTHLVLMIVSVGMKAQLTLGIYLLVGGAVLFGLGLALSLSREHLLMLPAKIKSREGIFKVLSWR